MRVAIYGAGAMGTTLGALLSASGVNAELISRNQSHIIALKNEGATIVCSADNQTLTIPVNAKTNAEMDGKYDVVFLMTKQRENKEIAKTILPYLKEDGFVCTTQNGLPEDALEEILGEDRVAGAVCTFGANFIEAGKVELTSKFSSARIEVGSKNARVAEDCYRLLLAIEKQYGVENFVIKSDNLAGVRWNKLALNSAFSTLSVVTGLTFGEIAKNGKTAKLALSILRECFAVQRTAGVQREKTQGHDIAKLFAKANPFARLLLPVAVKNHKRLTSGMLADLKKGRKCEVDFVAGAVLKKAETLGVNCPTLSLAVEIVHGIENGLYEIAPENTAFF